jgi:16S rRNA (guanine966-N2)-methyltransferase
MLDRVREAMFSTLGPGVEGCYALDLFAGSGSLGLEALSRGAAFARFVEDNPHVVKIITENVEALGLDDRTDLVNGSAIAPSSWLPPEGEPARWADVIFFDPPYPWLRDERRSSVFEAANRLALEVLRPGGLLVFHTPKRGADAHEFDDRLDADKRNYGSSALWYLRGPEESDSAETELETEPDKETEA